MLICLWAGAFMAFGPFLSPTYAYMPLGWSIHGLRAFSKSHICLYAFGLEHQWPLGLCYVPCLLICLWAQASVAFGPLLCPISAHMPLGWSMHGFRAFYVSLSSSYVFGLELLAFEPFYTHGLELSFWARAYAGFRAILILF